MGSVLANRMRFTRQTWKWIALSLGIGLVLAAGLSSPQLLALWSQRHPAPQNRIRFAVPGFQSSALVLLAEAKGFFRDERVDPSFEFRATGRDCLDLVLRGQADLAVVFETPTMHALLAGHRLSILTEVHSSEMNTAVVARKDHGINDAGDLLGKKIAVVSKTNAEFLLGLFLRTHLVDINQVQIQKMSIAEAVENLANGNVDAAALWQPYVSQSTAKDPEQFVLLRSSFYSELSMLTGLRDNLESQKETVVAVLRALMRARDFYDNHQREAREIVDRKLTSLGFFISPLAWDQMNIHLGLSSTLLTMLKEEAKWYESQNSLLHLGEPDLKEIMRGDYLSQIEPQLVTYE